MSQYPTLSGPVLDVATSLPSPQQPFPERLVTRGGPRRAATAAHGPRFARRRAWVYPTLGRRQSEGDVSAIAQSWIYANVPKAGTTTASKLTVRGSARRWRRGLTPTR
jgi:hypothetical protein